jgi:hypothetical protein
MRFLVGCIVIFFLGCSPDSEVPNSESGFIYSVDVGPTEELSEDSIITAEDNSQTKRINNNSGFLDSYHEIVLGVGMHNDSLFNSIIHKNYGLYIIESSGAMPMIRKFYNIGKFNTHNEKKPINELLYHEMEEPIFESLPKVICDENVYDKEGCFAQEINPLLDSQIWNYASLNEKEIQAIEFLAETVKITVVNTSNFTFYFSKIEGKWYLTFLDIRVPCSA